MCGIAGVINYQNYDLQKLINALKHRGPDAQAIYTENQIALLHTRLSIQDVKNGNQPFHYANYSMVFNGEIYNHHELRDHLKEFTFKTSSDTETLLYLFAKYEFKMFDMLDGMFAFCIYDKNKNKIILARDRAGKKPLYYYKDNGSFIFASELNAIKSATNLLISSDAINCYLRAGYIWKPYTAYQNVFELEAASYLELNINDLHYQKKSYFNLLTHYHSASSQVSLEENLIKLESRLTESIADRIAASDVEVGVFLSGGIDSNLIAAIASKIKPNIKTFTVKFDNSYDESLLANVGAKKYRTDHTVLEISTSLKEDIEKILLLYGEPFMDSSAIPSYYVSREARKHVKVVLGGDGADELFAGYRRYVPATHAFTSYFKLLAPVLKLMPKPTNKHSVYNYLYRLISMSNKKGLDYYLSATTDVFEDVLPIQNSMITQSLHEFVSTVFANKKLSSLNKMLYMDFSIILFCDLLVKMDIASMGNSLEVRSPFLSKHMLEFAPRLPDQLKINKLQTKFILRKLAEKYLPVELINQPKRGFEVPLKKWVDFELRDVICDTLKPGCYAENYVKKDFIQGLLHKRNDLSPEKRAKIVWSLYCLEVWYKNAAKNSLYS